MADSNPSRAEVDALFAQALGVPSAERGAFLQRACAGDEALLAEIRELLGFADDPDDPCGIGAGALWNALAAELADDPAPPERVGPWRVGRRIGRGGMGAVYLVTRADGEFEQTAALKLLRPGAASEDALRRFERERRIVARLQHPGIARLLDGGRTPEGFPYFVMEYVEGRPCSPTATRSAWA